MTKEIKFENPFSVNEEIKQESHSEFKINSYQYKDIKNSEKTSDSMNSNLKDNISSDSFLNQKNKRFILNSLVMDPISVEEERKKNLQEKVLEKVALIQEEARSLGSALGYEEGKKQGYIDAFEKTKQVLSSRIENFLKTIDSIDNAQRSIFQYNEKFLINLIFQICRQVILKELETDKEYLTRVIFEMLEKIETKEQITIRINSEDFEFIENLEDKISLKFKSLKNFKIASSQELSQGTCQVETEWNMFQSSYDQQLKEIYNFFVNKKTSSDFVNENNSI